MKKALVTGCLGNLGTSVSLRLLESGYHVTGTDNMARKNLGKEADVSENLKLLDSKNFEFESADFESYQFPFRDKQMPDVIVHCAAQVSHPYSIEHPWEDFMTNAYGTFRMLEWMRNHAPNTQLIHIGTAKIYGKNVDRLFGKIYDELETRYWYPPHFSYQGIDESCSFDQTIKTPFGCSKACADLYVQEYGRLYGLHTVVLRPGVFTGRYAKPVIYQNWVGDLMKEILTQDHVDIIGWNGKQVRDVLHTDDLVDAIMMIIERPPPKGEVYNIGGGMQNAVSVIEAFKKICDLTGNHPSVGFKPARPGDWCVYVTDNSKLQKQYPDWKVSRDLDFILHETFQSMEMVL